MGALVRKLIQNVDEFAKRLVKEGYPENTANKIATGELPMDFQSRMSRAQEQGFTDDFYHVGYKDPREEFRGWTFLARDPEVAATYADYGDSTSRLLINPKGFREIDAQHYDFASIPYKPDQSDLEPINEILRRSGYDLKDVPGPTDEIAGITRQMGDKGVLIKNIVDFGGNTAASNADWIANYRAFADEIDDITQRGGDIVILHEKGRPQARNYYGAAFDPDNVNKPSILGALAPVGVSGIFGALGNADDTMGNNDRSRAR